jgi:hypothetical protein
LTASYATLSGESGGVEKFPQSIPTLMVTSVMLSIIPLLIYAMFVLSWCQRKAKIRRIADLAYAEELKLVEELKRKGVITLRYDDPLLEHAEFLVNITGE